jgi:hypothetical protein
MATAAKDLSAIVSKTMRYAVPILAIVLAAVAWLMPVKMTMRTGLPALGISFLLASVWFGILLARGYRSDGMSSFMAWLSLLIPSFMLAIVGAIIFHALRA